MGWARGHIEKLRAGEIVSFRPHGTGQGQHGSGVLMVPDIDPKVDYAFKDGRRVEIREMPKQCLLARLNNNERDE